MRCHRRTFAGTREWIGGFDLLECGDIAEAVEIASRHPRGLLREDPQVTEPPENPGRFRVRTLAASARSRSDARHLDAGLGARAGDGLALHVRHPALEPLARGTGLALDLT